MQEPNSKVAVHSAFDAIEGAFHAALDASLEPRGPDSLYELVAGLGLSPGASVVDVGCGRGDQAFELARRFGFDVLGVDPAARHEAVERQFAEQTHRTGGLRFAEATAESIPIPASSIDLIFCRESLMYADLGAAALEFKRVLRPGGRGLIYLVLTGPLLSDEEADLLWRPLPPNNLRPSDIEAALTAVGFEIDERVDYKGEWGERAQEREGVAGQRLLYASRLLREPAAYIAEFGQNNYDIMLADCLWHVYRMIGKLAGYACTFTKP